MFEIGVVGGGASAVCLLDALAQADSAPGGLTVFEPAADLWRGRPFQHDMETVRVNAPPADMSVRFGDTRHFERWLGTRDVVAGAEASYEDGFCGARFVPRSVFGDYLDDSAGAALVRLLERGWRISVIRECVASAAPVMHGMELQTERGTRVTVDYTVLCVGVGRPADIYSLAGHPGFIPEPYPVFRTLAGVNTEDEVGVLGSGLTGVDAVLTLAARGHQGRIRLLSRRGVLPGVRQRPVPYTLQHFTPARFRAAAARGEALSLKQLIAVMCVELAAAGEEPSSITDELAALQYENPVRRLRRHLAEVDSPRLALRILQRAVPDTGPDVWPLLPEREKSDLLRSHYRAVMSLCCPMPPTSAATLLGLIDSGQLEIVSGLRHIEPRSSGGFVITSDIGECASDIVVNAVSPPAHKVPARAAPLMSSLITAKVADRHPRGGLRVDRPTSQVTASGAANPALYALGDLASGSPFFTFGVPSLADRAYDIATAILDDARTNQTSQVVHALQSV